MIPRDELLRALSVTRKKAHGGAALLATGLAALAGAFFLVPMDILSLGFLSVGGLTASIIGGVQLAHARRAKVTIESKLRAQQLPSARIV